MITIKDGDLFSAPIGIICHQVNCKGVMGRGVAKTFKMIFPNAYNNYLEVCTNTEDSSSLLGSVLFCIEETGKTCCMFAQNDWRGQGQKTDYKAFRICCQKIKQYIDSFGEKYYCINMPYMIGCGLGGGDWNVIYSILEEQFKEYNVILWKLD